MAHEYVFRGEREPYAPDPEEQRARERAIREADRLVDVTPHDRESSIDAEVMRRIAEYQVGGLDGYGAFVSATELESDSARDSPSHDDEVENPPPPMKTRQGDSHVRE